MDADAGTLDLRQCIVIPSVRLRSPYRAAAVNERAGTVRSSSSRRPAAEEVRTVLVLASCQAVAVVVNGAAKTPLLFVSACFIF